MGLLTEVYKLYRPILIKSTLMKNTMSLQSFFKITEEKNKANVGKQQE